METEQLKNRVFKSKREVIAGVVVLIVVVIGVSFLSKTKSLRQYGSDAQIFSETFSDVQISFQLPSGWTRLSEGWHSQDPIFQYALSGYISPESKVYNQGSVCPKARTDEQPCIPRDPRYDFVIEDVWVDNGAPYVYGTSKVTPQVIGGNTFFVYRANIDQDMTKDRTVYSFAPVTNVEPLHQNHYYTFSFTPSVSLAVRSAILESLTYKVTESLTTKPVDTSGWKTYQNEKYGRVVKVPVDWRQFGTNTHPYDDYLQLGPKGLQSSIEVDSRRTDDCSKGISSCIKEYRVAYTASQAKASNLSYLRMNGYDAATESITLHDVYYKTYYLLVNNVFTSITLNISSDEQSVVLPLFEQVVSSIQFNN